MALRRKGSVNFAARERAAKAFRRKFHLLPPQERNAAVAR